MDQEHKTKEIPLASGATLLRVWEEDTGWHYVSDEVGGGVTVWFPALVDPDTVRAALNDYLQLTEEEE